MKSCFMFRLKTLFFIWSEWSRSCRKKKTFFFFFLFYVLNCALPTYTKTKEVERLSTGSSVVLRTDGTEEGGLDGPGSFVCGNIPPAFTLRLNPTALKRSSVYSTGFDVYFPAETRHTVRGPTRLP